jgi:hypothetical protein
MRGIAEEAPGAYKDAEAVVLTAEKAGLAKRVASGPSSASRAEQARPTCNRGGFARNR